MMQIIGEDRAKSAFKEIHAIRRRLPNYPEFHHKNLIDNGFISEEHLRKYFPDDPYKVDRHFCWTVFETCEPERARKFFNQVLDTKLLSRKVRKAKNVAMTLNEEYL